MKLTFESSLPDAGLSVAEAPMVVRPGNLSRYLLRLLRRAEPEAPVSAISHTIGFTTDLGWSGRVVRHGASVAACYEMFHFTAGVVIRAASEADLDGVGDAIRAYLCSARPDFQGDPVTLTLLWT